MCSNFEVEHFEGGPVCRTLQWAAGLSCSCGSQAVDSYHEGCSLENLFLPREPCEPHTDGLDKPGLTENTKGLSSFTSSFIHSTNIYKVVIVHYIPRASEAMMTKVGPEVLRLTLL